MKKYRNITQALTFLFLSHFLLQSCSPPEEVKLKDLCFEKYKNEDITTEGIILLPSKMTTSSALIPMVIKDEKTDLRVPSLQILGSNTETRNCMRYLPSTYSEEDVEIFDDNGDAVKLGERVRVTGKIRGASQAWCDLWVEKIEKVK